MIQDPGCNQSALKESRYHRAKILSVGPVGNELFYFRLTAIAVEYIKYMTTEMKSDKGWKKSPNNPVNAKAKIVQLTL